MTTKPHGVIPHANQLPTLAASINDHLAAADAATRRGLEHAIAAGLLLIEAKELVPHGEWLPWLQANCRLGERQARTYMRLARHRHRLESAVTADLTIAAAEALVGRPRPERPRGLPGQLDLLGGPEVTAPAVIANHAPEVSERERLNHLIVGLEYALAVIRAAERTTLRGPNGRIAIGIAKEWIKQRARLAAAASTVTTALAFLKDLRRAPR